MKGVLEAAGLKLPYLLDPRPNSYIEELRDEFDGLDYSKSENLLKVENATGALAHSSTIVQPAAA